MNGEGRPKAARATTRPNGTTGGQRRERLGLAAWIGAGLEDLERGDLEGARGYLLAARAWLRASAGGAP
jgi:hypothetical protein